MQGGPTTFGLESRLMIRNAPSLAVEDAVAWGIIKYLQFQRGRGPCFAPTGKAVQYVPLPALQVRSKPVPA